jgi:hypothetical protein
MRLVRLMFRRERHAWVMTSLEYENTFGIVGVFQTESAGRSYAAASGMEKDKYQLTGWEVEKS